MDSSSLGEVEALQDLARPGNRRQTRRIPQTTSRVPGHSSSRWRCPRRVCRPSRCQTRTGHDGRFEPRDVECTDRREDRDQRVGSLAIEHPDQYIRGGAQHAGPEEIGPRPVFLASRDDQQDPRDHQHEWERAEERFLGRHRVHILGAAQRIPEQYSPQTIRGALIAPDEAAPTTTEAVGEASRKSSRRSRVGR